MKNFTKFNSPSLSFITIFNWVRLHSSYALLNEKNKSECFSGFNEPPDILKIFKFTKIHWLYCSIGLRITDEIIPPALRIESKLLFHINFNFASYFNNNEQLKTAEMWFRYTVWKALSQRNLGTFYWSLLYFRFF